MTTREGPGRPRVFNTPFESGLHSVVLLTACFPAMLGLHRLVVFDYMMVHSTDVGGPPSLHPGEDYREAELLVRRPLVEAGLALMATGNLVLRSATPIGFRYQAGPEAGSFVDLLSSSYSVDLKDRAIWLSENIAPMEDQALADLVRSRLDQWTPEFQAGEASLG